MLGQQAYILPAPLQAVGAGRGVRWCGAALEHFKAYCRPDGAMTMTTSSLLLARTCVHGNQQGASDSSNVEAVKQRLQGLQAGM